MGGLNCPALIRKAGTISKSRYASLSATLPEDFPLSALTPPAPSRLIRPEMRSLYLSPKFMRPLRTTKPALWSVASLGASPSNDFQMAPVRAYPPKEKVQSPEEMDMGGLSCPSGEAIAMGIEAKEMGSAKEMAIGLRFIVLRTVWRGEF